MPNGGQISCPYCTYSRRDRNISFDGTCDIWGIECNPFRLCRTFRLPKQSHTEARERWPLLNELKPGIVYYIDNGGTNTTGQTKPMYKVIKIEENQ